MTLRSIRDASPPTSSSWGRDDSLGPHHQPELLWGAIGSGEQHLVEQQVADLLPATSRGVQQEANALPQEHRSGHAMLSSTF